MSCTLYNVKGSIDSLCSERRGGVGCHIIGRKIKECHANEMIRPFLSKVYSLSCLMKPKRDNLLVNFCHGG